MSPLINEKKKRIFKILFAYIIKESFKKCKVWTQASVEYDPQGRHFNPQGPAPGVDYLFVRKCAFKQVKIHF